MDTTLDIDSTREARSTADRVFALPRAIDDVRAWAMAPLRDAERITAELVALAERRALPPAALRMLTQSALGEPARLAVVDRWLEEDPEVQQVIARVRDVARGLDGAGTRGRAASRRALELALTAPELVRRATREIWQQGPSCERDAILRRLEHAPAQIKACSEGIRAELASLQVRADAARERIIDGLRVRARIARRTDRLLAV